MFHGCTQDTGTPALVLPAEVFDYASQLIEYLGRPLGFFNALPILGLRGSDLGTSFRGLFQGHPRYGESATLTFWLPGAWGVL